MYYININIIKDQSNDRVKYKPKYKRLRFIELLKIQNY